MFTIGLEEKIHHVVARDCIGHIHSVHRCVKVNIKRMPTSLGNVFASAIKPAKAARLNFNEGRGQNMQLLQLNSLCKNTRNNLITSKEVLRPWHWKGEHRFICLIVHGCGKCLVS